MIMIKLILGDSYIYFCIFDGNFYTEFFRLVYGVTLIGAKMGYTFFLEIYERPHKLIILNIQHIYFNNIFQSTLLKLVTSDQ